MASYVLTVAIGIDITLNAILGGAAYQTLSCRIGLSILAGGWASKVPWPRWLYNHFTTSVFTTTV